MLENIRNEPYEERLHKLHLTSMTFKRLRGYMIEVFKILHPTSEYDNRVCNSLLKKCPYEATLGYLASSPTRSSI